MSYLVVFITMPNQKEAEKIALVLLQKKLAACVNLVSKVKSLYWWQGKIEKAGEVLLIIKTLKNKLTALIKNVKKLHSYQVPEIIVLPIIGGNQKYLNWIKEVIEG